MPLVAGIDSSTQSCKVVIRDAATGRLERQGRASHPPGSQVDPEHWWSALGGAAAQAGGLDDVAAVAVAGQQHGLVALDNAGQVIRPAILWNDTRSAAAAKDLINELGGGSPQLGAQKWAKAVGTVPVASLTVTKLRWLAEHEPANAQRLAAACLPHDWLTWRLAETSGNISELVTDRSDASGTGYWSGVEATYRTDLLRLGLGKDCLLPRVLDPLAVAGHTPKGQILGPGAGDNAAAALGLQLAPGDVAISLGTSGVVSVIADRPTADATGLVAGFADATGVFLPLACTLNASRILDAARQMLGGVSHDELSRLALSAPDGADGLVMVPYLEGERTPNKPQATAALHGWRLANSTAAHLARAAVEGLLCLMADCLDAIVELGIAVERIVLIGGGARSQAVRQLAPKVLGRAVSVPPAGEYVADGAARQAAGVTLGAWPKWPSTGEQVFSAAPVSQIREQYAAVRELTALSGQGSTC